MVPEFGPINVNVTSLLEIKLKPLRAISTSTSSFPKSLS